LSIFKKSQENKFSLSLLGISGTMHEDQYTFMIISRSLLLKNVLDKGIENITTWILYSIFF